MQKSKNGYIEWLVTIAIVYITTLNMLGALMDAFKETYLHSLVSFSLIPLLILMLLYQSKHYGIKSYNKLFYGFYILYCLYIFLYITIFRRYPLDQLQSVPKSVLLYFFDLIVSFCFFFCAPIIYHHFNVRKYLLISLIVCTIPSILFLHYVGIDLIQAGIEDEDEDFIQTLVVTYANVPLLLIAVFLFKKLFREKWISMIVSSSIFASVSFVIIAFGKRGPLLWTIVGILICFLISSTHIKKHIFIFGLIGISFFCFLDPILDGLSETLPRTGKKLELSIKEGNTSKRFDLNNPEDSHYLIGLEEFSKSPLYGYYFRHVTRNKEFQGTYPHNVFVEILMTMGLVGFIPFMYLLIRAFLKSRKVLLGSYTENQIVFFILFLCPFLQFQTSGTIIFKYDFWLFFYILCSIDVLARTKDKRCNLQRRLQKQ